MAQKGERGSKCPKNCPHGLWIPQAIITVRYLKRDRGVDIVGVFNPLQFFLILGDF